MYGNVGHLKVMCRQAEAERVEIGDFFVGGHYRSAKAKAATERSSFTKGSASAAAQEREPNRQRRPTVGAISPDKMQSWVRSQAEQAMQKEAHMVSSRGLLVAPHIPPAEPPSQLASPRLQSPRPSATSPRRTCSIAPVLP